MLRAYGRFDQNAYRIPGAVASTVTTLEPGQWVTLNSAGEVVVADGTKRAFMNMNSLTADRDNVSAQGKTTYLVGSFLVETSKYNTGGSYPAGVLTPLKVTTAGVLTPWTTGTDAAELLVAYAKGAPTSDGYLTIIAR